MCAAGRLLGPEDFPARRFLDRLAAAVLDVVLVLIGLQLVLDRMRDDGPAPLILFVLRRVLGVEGHDRGRNHLQPACGARRWCAAAVRGRPGPRPLLAVFDWRARPRLSLDPSRSRRTGLARQDRRHVRRESSPQLSSAVGRPSGLAAPTPPRDRPGNRAQSGVKSRLRAS